MEPTGKIRSREIAKGFDRVAEKLAELAKLSPCTAELPIVKGSRAARFWDEKFREPNDWDFIMPPKTAISA